MVAVEAGPGSVMTFKFKSQWLSIVTLGGLALAVVALPKHPAPTVMARGVVPAEGIDYTPIGSSHAMPVPKARRRRI